MATEPGGQAATAPPRESFARRAGWTPTTATGRKLAINLIALALLCLVLSLLNDRFLTQVNVTNVLRQIAAVATVGSVITLLMVSGGLDLSIGGVVALSGCTAALLSNTLPLPVAFAAGVGVGALVGLLNAVLVVVIGINSVIATLGTMYVSQGSTLLVTGGVPVYQVRQTTAGSAPVTSGRCRSPSWSCCWRSWRSAWSSGGPSSASTPSRSAATRRRRSSRVSRCAGPRWRSISSPGRWPGSAA
ncbi:MAG: ABC transporter permease [Chloroflexia bacterium]|nr:ABC transporter permease [Chloroflexia bacterium]